MSCEILTQFREKKLQTGVDFLIADVIKKSSFLKMNLLYLLILLGDLSSNFSCSISQKSFIPKIKKTQRGKKVFQEKQHFHSSEKLA